MVSSFLFILFIIGAGGFPVPDKSHIPLSRTVSDQAPIIGYDCNQTEPEVLSISTLEIESCPEISSLTPQVIQSYGQIIQRHDLESVKIYTCQLTKSTHYVKCGRNWHNYNVYPPTIGNILDVQSNKCIKTHETGYYKWSYGKEPWGDLVANKTYIFSANEVGWTDSVGYCEGGTVEINGQTYKDIVVQVSFTFSLRESWGTVDHTSNMLNIEGTLSCPYKEGSCQDARTGTHVWIPLTQKCPEDQYRLLYQGEVNITTSKENPIALLSINNPPFLFTTELGANSFVCQITLRLTEFPNIYFSEQRSGAYQLTLPKPGENDIKFLTYLNAKMTFLYHNIVDSMQKMYLASLHETCKVEREMLRNRIEIIRLNSMAGGLSSLLKPGMFAKVNGEIIHLIKCKPVAVKFRNTKDCYDALPILHNDKPVFLLPNTHIISPYSSLIQCSPISPVTYKIGNSWWAFTGSFQQAPNPTILAPSTDFTPKFQIVKTFSKGGMYSQEQVEAIQKLLIFPQLREAITTEFVRGVTKFSPSPVALDMTTIMSDADWKTIAKRNIESVWGYFSSIGSTISGFIGLYFLYRLIKGIINCFLDGHDLYKLFGCSLYLLSSIWGRLAQYFINRAALHTSNTQTSSQNNSKIEENIPLQEVTEEAQPSGTAPTFPQYIPAYPSYFSGYPVAACSDKPTDTEIVQ